MWCAITPERQEKTERIMKALAAGCGGRVCFGAPPDDGKFAVWGHKWLSEQIVPPAHRDGRPWWFVDNGYYMSARGQEHGYYSLTYRGFWPVMLDDPDMKRLAIDMKPWKAKSDGYVLLALPGMAYGRILGFDMQAWCSEIKDKVRRHTNRKVVQREKGCRRRLESDLYGASVVVTHSSKVAVDAVIAGVPCIVAPTNPAAPVCGTDLAMINDPPRPDRVKWWQSLMCQQFTIREMRNGTAKYWMDAIEEQVDANGEVSEGLRLEAAAVGDFRIQGRLGASGDNQVCAGCNCQGTCRGGQKAAEGENR